MSRRDRRRALELCCEAPDADVHPAERGHTLEVSFHAIDRYLERIDPTATREDAEAVIRAAMQGARRLHDQGRHRAFYQAGAGVPFRMVVRERPGRAPAVMTVLPLRGEDLDDD